MLRLKRNKPCPHLDTCPVNPKDGVCYEHCRDKILLEYYLLKMKYDQISMKYYEMSKEENESYD